MNTSQDAGGQYRHNHYVPQWYQKHFLPNGTGERKFYHLDLKPPSAEHDGVRFTKKALNRWGPPTCFAEHDLYTTRFGAELSTQIEQEFFGPIDANAQAAVNFFASYEPPSVDNFALHGLMDFMSLQKLRTPKGLAWLSLISKADRRETDLLLMQRIRGLHTDTWLEGVWQIADARNSPTKFIVSDHPVTVYNRLCSPLSRWCRGAGDPDIWLSGTHTLFPLSMSKILIITNLSWVRNPYEDARYLRPNPGMFRGSMFSYLDIQVQRDLSEQEVREMNFIIKSRANRYVAAAEENWLFPERHLTDLSWDSFGQRYLCMPDPRSVSFGSTYTVGYKDGTAAAFDVYGRRPGQADFDDKRRSEREWRSFSRFQGEFARLFGPVRRGRSFTFSRLDSERDDPEFHAHTLAQEAIYTPSTRTSRPKKRRAKGRPSRV